MAYGACAIDGRSSKGGRARVTILVAGKGLTSFAPFFNKPFFDESAAAQTKKCAFSRSVQRHRS